MMRSCVWLAFLAVLGLGSMGCGDTDGTTPVCPAPDSKQACETAPQVVDAGVLVPAPTSQSQADAAKQ